MDSRMRNELTERHYQPLKMQKNNNKPFKNPEEYVASIYMVLINPI